MKIIIACDHHGVKRKKELMKYLISKGNEVEDYGTDSTELVDYPEYAFKVSKDIVKRKADLGILLCGTGIGMSIAANKVKGIRCAKIDSIKDAHYAKEHNFANVLAMSSTKPLFIVKDMLNEFFNTEPSKVKRYKDRDDMISAYEK